MQNCSLCKTEPMSKIMLRNHSRNMHIIPFPDFPANPAKWCGICLILERPEPTDATLLYLEAKRSWRWSEGPSEGIRRIRRGFPEEEPSDTANERGQAQATPSGGAAAIRPATPRAFPSARRVSSRRWTRRAADPWGRAHARTWGARALERPS